MLLMSSCLGGWALSKAKRFLFQEARNLQTSNIMKEQRDIIFSY